MRLGLRERFVAVLAAVSALTLVVAAVALFSPLDRLLRADARDRLAQAVDGELVDFSKLPAEAVRPGSPRLRAAMQPLRRTGGDIVDRGARGAEDRPRGPDRH